MQNEEIQKAQPRNPTGRTNTETEKSCEETYQQNNQPQRPESNYAAFMETFNFKQQIKTEKSLFTLSLSLSALSRVCNVNVC